jgi:hypothetical protein
MRFSSLNVVCCLLCACSTPPPVDLSEEAAPLTTRDSMAEALVCREESRDLDSRLAAFCEPDGFVRTPYGVDLAFAPEVAPWPTRDLVLEVTRDGLVVEGGYETAPARIEAAIDTQLAEHLRLQTRLLRRQPSPTYVLKGHLDAPTAVVAAVVSKMFNEGYPDVWVGAHASDPSSLEFSDEVKQQVGKLPARPGERFPAALEVMREHAAGCDEVSELIEAFAQAPEEDRCALFALGFASMYRECGCAADAEAVFLAYTETQGKAAGVSLVRLGHQGRILPLDVSKTWGEEFSKFHLVDEPVHPYW